MRRLPSPPYVFAAVGAFILVGAVAGGIYWAAGGNSSHERGTITTVSAASTHPATMTHRQYALLYLHAILHKTRISVLKNWPSPPYQHYSSGKQTCYEWWDKPIALYNLCFHNGVLSLKAIE